MNEITSYLKRNWQGGLLGALGGLGATWIYQKLGYSLTFALIDTNTLADKVIGVGTSLQQLAFTKVAILLMLFGAGIGMYLDEKMREGWWKKWL